MMHSVIGRVVFYVRYECLANWFLNDWICYSHAVI